MEMKGRKKKAGLGEGLEKSSGEVYWTGLRFYLEREGVLVGEEKIKKGG